MTTNEQVFRSKKSALRLLSDDLVNQTRDMLEKLVEMRESRQLSVSEVADIMGVADEDIRDFESYTADPHLDDIVSYALAVKARLSIEVTDGDVWARRALSPVETQAIHSWVRDHVPAAGTSTDAYAKDASAYVKS
jgi:hypothetical protein